MVRKEKTFELIISEIDFYIINRVRELREAEEISQVDLSIAMELTEGAIGKIENPKERAKYNIRHLNLLAKALNCSPRDLLPDKPLANDMVKITFKINRANKSRKGEPYFEVLKVEKFE
jgi:transcriptional regulator with XRE-family HTH domain